MKIIAREAYFVPLKRVSPEQIAAAKERNTFQFYKDSACEKCPYFEDRPCDTCIDCPNNLGSVTLVKTVEVNEKLYLSIPIGDRAGLNEIFPDEEIEIIPKYPVISMKGSPKFIGGFKKFPFQPAAIADMLKKKRGVLKSAPRTGKTAMAAAAICKLGYKTIILAAQRDWLVNFQETFIGSKTQKAMTDLNPKRIGFARTLEDFQRYDVCLVTYQLFISPKGQKLLEKVRKLFTVMVVDEVHRGNSTVHARVISKFACKYKWGLSGTPQRKDKKHVIVKRLMGPILHKTDTERLVPRIELVPTNVSTERDYKTWVYMIRFLEEHPQRLKLIAKWALRDVKAGHLVLIPMTRIKVVRALTAAINRMSEEEEPIAAAFYGGVQKADRDRIIQRARNYKYKVIVGNTRLISTGINIPRASCLYQCSPSSNMPNAEQRFSRILTPYSGKPNPLIRVFADEMKVVKACFRAEYWGVLYRMFRPRMDEDTRDKLYTWMNKTPRKGFDSFKAGGAI